LFVQFSPAMRAPMLFSLLLTLGLSLAACSSEDPPVIVDYPDARLPDAALADAGPTCRDTMTWCEDGKILVGRLRDDACGGVDTCVSNDTLHFSEVHENVDFFCEHGCATGEAATCRHCESADGGIPFCGDHIENLCAPAP
jgi:hypothetical protein